MGKSSPSNPQSPNKRYSAFSESDLQSVVDYLKQEIKDLYCDDGFPWIVGYSGGKDSTAVLQLVWLALRELPPAKLTKTVHVISTDTLVENPIVAAWVTRSLNIMAKSAQEDALPITPHRLTPRIEDSFWVNLIGKGYPSPRPKFRWCTERMKIKPSNTFINSVVKQSSEAILLLGSRKAESTARARTMVRHEKHRVRDRLSPNASLVGTLVYTPIEDWSNDDVWMFLMQIDNPWKHSNKDLLTMYAGATSDGECPLVVDTSTPSCGDSRFGCWVCTMVELDKSMAAMIQNDQEKEWMLPLMKLRDELDNKDDRSLRDFRRMSGHIQLFHDRPIPGPYRQDIREHWLERLLQAQTWIRENGPTASRKIDLITIQELEEIRRIWVIDKHELEDHLPAIYHKATGKPYPGRQLDDNLVIGPDDMRLLAEICGRDRIHYELTRELLDVSRRNRNLTRRSRVYGDLEAALRRGYYGSAEDATEKARKHQTAVQRAKDIRQKELPLSDDKDPL
ncbi:MAG: DNA phosphorothioation system sulfurtransferase DndC [Kiritimatiellae bacterium]|nr:DNA phosphorothioation system sulfurtransferase DndC [Kiritimatiellia bacterium]MDD5519515.1 DNA phosphorothioation system sulfurtransferase DndC [Kiritimatiellia bacterium]